MRVLEHARVEPAEHVWRVVLRVGGADGLLELRGEVVPVEGVGGAGEVGAEWCKVSVREKGSSMICIRTRAGP